MRTFTKLAATATLALGMAAGMAGVAGAASPPTGAVLPTPTIGATSLLGPAGMVHLSAPITDGTTDPARAGGYWLVGADGGVFAFGGAPYLGSLPGVGVKPVAPVTEIVSTPGGHGYWLVASDGGVFAFGSAPFLGSARSDPVAGPVTLTPIVVRACGQKALSGYSVSWAGGSVTWTHVLTCDASASGAESSTARR